MKYRVRFVVAGKICSRIWSGSNFAETTEILQQWDARNIRIPVKVKKTREILYAALIHPLVNVLPTSEL